MGYSVRHETSNICSGTVEKGARTSGSLSALQRCLRDAPIPDPSGERPRRVSPKIARSLGCASQTVRNAIRAFNERGIDALTPGSSRPNRVHAAFDEKSAEALRQMLHRSPREFGRNSSLWTLEMVADVAFEEGLTTERVSGETIRATLSRLLRVRWMRAKRWITSPDPLYERKKEGATD
jgi:transposase